MASMMTSGRLAPRMILLALVLSVIVGAPSVAAPMSQVLAGPFSPADGLKAFVEQTGLPLAERGSAAKLETGQCTWFVHSVCPLDLPVEGMAASYYGWAQGHGMSVSRKPVVGSVAVWSTDVAGTGHVGYVTAVDVESGTFDVWDSNWGPKDDLQVRLRRHSSNDDRLLGFVSKAAPPPVDVPRPPPAVSGVAEEERRASRPAQLAIVTLDAVVLRDFANNQSRRILGAEGGGSAVAWTPDGRELLYAEGATLFALDPDSGQRRCLVRHANSEWAIDGIAVHPTRPAVWYTVTHWDLRKDTVGTGLWRVDLAGGPPTKLATVNEQAGRGGMGAVERLVWLPDGNSVVIGVEPTHMRPGVYLVRYGLNGAVQELPLSSTMATANWPAACTPSWSRDGQSILWPQAVSFAGAGFPQTLLLPLISASGGVRYTLRHRCRGDNRVVSCEVAHNRPWFAYATSDGLFVWDHQQGKQVWRTKEVLRFAWRP